MSNFGVKASRGKKGGYLLGEGVSGYNVFVEKDVPQNFQLLGRYHLQNRIMHDLKNVFEILFES